MALENAVLLSAGFGTGAKTLPAFTLSGTDRLVPVFVIGNDILTLSGVTIGGTTMTDASRVITTTRLSIHVYWLGEGGLAANGDYDIVATPTVGAVFHIGAFCLSGREDQVYDADNDDTPASSQTYACQVTTVTDNSDVVGAASHAQFTTTHTETGDLSEEATDTGTYGAAIGFFADGAAGTVDHNGSFSAAARDIVSMALAFAPVAAAAAALVAPALLRSSAVHRAAYH